MARYYMRLGDTFFHLDATTNISVTYPAKLSNLPMHDGSVQSDHYTVEQPSCTISGLITDIKILRDVTDKPTGKWIDDLLQLAMRNRAPVILKHRVDGEEEENWFITSFKPTQDNTKHKVSFQGSEGQVQQAFSINVQLKQALISQGLTTTVQPSQEYLDALQAKGKKNSATQQFSNTAKGLKGSGRSFGLSKGHAAAVGRNLGEAVSLSNDGEDN